MMYTCRAEVLSLVAVERGSKSWADEGEDGQCIKRVALFVGL